MKKNLLIFLTLFFACTIIAQDDIHYVKLKIKDEAEHFEFRSAGVIDARSDTLLGFVKKKSKAIPAQIKGDFSETMNEALHTLVSGSIDLGPEFTFIFHRVQIKEWINNASGGQSGYCEVEVEVAKQVDDQWYSLGIFEANVNSGGLDVTQAHGRRIARALQHCLSIFNKTDWKNNPGKAIDINNLKYKYDYTAIPPKGLYRSFGELARRTPAEGIDFKITPLQTKGKQSQQFFVELNDNKLKKYYTYLSDGENLYLIAHERGNGAVYLKAEHPGKYWYFETKYSNPDMAALFGLIGVIVSYKGRSVVYDTTTNNLEELNDYQIYKITKEHPEILKTYKKSRRKNKDKKNVIALLNEKRKVEEGR